MSAVRRRLMSIVVLVFSCGLFLPAKIGQASGVLCQQIVIRLGSTLEKFEEELCTMVLNEYNQQQGATVGGSAQVIKRYLRVRHYCISLSMGSGCLEA